MIISIIKTFNELLSDIFKTYKDLTVIKCNEILSGDQLQQLSTSQNKGYKNCLVTEVTEIRLHYNSFIRDEEFTLSRSWNPVFQYTPTGRHQKRKVHTAT